MKITTEKELLQMTVGTYCKQYRRENMGITLLDLSKDVDMPYKTLYSFERGLSSNLYMPYIYYVRVKDPNHFVKGLLDVLGQVKINE